jgi:hypothetical protein
VSHVHGYPFGSANASPRGGPFLQLGLKELLYAIPAHIEIVGGMGQVWRALYLGEHKGLKIFLRRKDRPDTEINVDNDGITTEYVAQMGTMRLISERSP